MGAMAILSRGDGEKPLTVAANNLVGRASTCTIRLVDPRVSSAHARITWRRERWEIRDLGSRNGTFVNGVRLEHGSSVKLVRGDSLSFGASDVPYVLTDASPPVALARELESGAILMASDGFLVLPSEDVSAMCVFNQPHDSRWMAEVDGQAREVRDGEVVQVVGCAYMLHLPVALAPTMDASDDGIRVADLDLHFRVSQDEERVELFLEQGGEVQVIPPRAHHYTLLTLARLRQQAQEDRHVPASARGWVSVDDLCRMLATDETKLNVEIYRIRRELSRKGVSDPAAIIERRRGQRMLRMGETNVVISRIP